jgi:hypothetical protein
VPDVEVCDGFDNDCNGSVDENLTAPPGTCPSVGICAGQSIAACVTPAPANAR